MTGHAMRQVRVSMGGPVGFDNGAIFETARACGIDLAALALYLPHIETGMMEAVVRQAKERK